MRKWKLLSLIMFVTLGMITNNLMAQDVPISGTVLTEDGAPLPGVSVMIVGTGRATVTDIQGKFTITAKEGAMLEFSHVGFSKQKVKATAGMKVNLLLGDTGQMQDVVVTAMGIKKERKALGYSVTELNASELMKNKNTNIVNSLVGKVPGVNVTQFSGAAGAGASITIRGGNSTSDGRQNQPLFVIDGVIYDNSTTVPGNTGTDGMSRSNTTYSNRVMDLNPEDIESLSVLKGAAAAALYGSRAADGVIIITTKKGVEGTAKVNVASKVITSWANKIPEAQTKFGNGRYASTNGVLDNITYSSWGLPLTEADTTYDNIGDFFQHGVVYDNNVNVSGGNKNGSFFLSGSNFKQNGIVRNTGFDKTTFRFNGEQKYGHLTLNANVAYSVANIDRTLTTAGLYNGGGNGVMGAIYNWPQVFNAKNYQNLDGSQYRRFPTQNLENEIDNPYWIINKDKLTSQTKRITGAINANYKITNWWDVTARLGYDQYNTNDYAYIAKGSAVIPVYQNGRLSKSLAGYSFTTTTVMSNFHKSFKGFDTRLMLGTTSENTEWVSQNHWGHNFITAGTVSFNNIAQTNQLFKDGTTQKRLVGAYGEFGISYKDIAYLTATGRNDWSSTLPMNNRSYFYPSISGSLVFTELIPQIPALSFGKIRASWAQVGKDANPYATLTYVNAPLIYGSFVGIGNQVTSGNPFLKPEIQNSWEIGGELRFLRNRIGIDYTYYHSQTNNQIAQPRLSNASGYILTSINSGSVINKGMEIALTGKAIVQKDFSWDVMLNFSYNKGRLGAFLPGVTFFYPTDAQFGTVRAASIPNGGYFLGMTGNTFYRETDAAKKEIANGRYVVDTTTGLYRVNNTNPIVGNREPDFIAGFNNTFRYKHFVLSFLIDIRKGGDVYNGTEYAMVVNGLSKKTTENDRQFVTVSGVDQAGNAYDKTYYADQSYKIGSTTQSGKYLIQKYWENYAQNSYNFITSVNWVKLRSLSLTYDFTSMLKNKKIIKEISATAIGTNLWTITNYKGGLDPEVSAAGGTGGSGSTGIDYLGVPAVASFTFGVNMTF